MVLPPLRHWGEKMKKLLALFYILSFLCIVANGNAFAAKFKITRVYDGDTVMAQGTGVTIYVMLLGIDAPEISERESVPSQPYAKAARDFLKRVVLNKEVTIKGYGKAPFPDNNIIGVIYLGEKNINLEMVRHGLAEACEKCMPEGFDITPFLKAEEIAKKNKIGMWSLGEKYISPRKWREMYKQKSGPCTR